MTDNEKLIEEAREAVGVAKDSIWRTSPDADGDARHEAVLDRMLAVFEAAHTPTNDEREALAAQYAFTHGDSQTRADFLAGWDAAATAGFRRTEVPEPSLVYEGWEQPETVIERILDEAGYDVLQPWRSDVVRAIAAWASAQPRSEVPEPSAEDEFAPGECTGAGDCDAAVHIHGCYRPHRADQCDAPDEYGHLPEEPQGEPSDAVVEEFMRSFWSYAPPPGGESRVRAALRAAGVVGQEGEQR